jgi:two-component system cell cycle sensor histidine kinase/response regulator CckA
MDTDLISVSDEPIPGVEVLFRKNSEQRFAAVGRKRILVVDDDTVVLSVISKILACLGYDVVAGNNGIEGLALCQEKPCEFVLTDLDMPAMDGLTLARHIKTKYPFVPVVLMTGNQAAEDRISTEIQKGFIDDFLFKPVRLADLRGTLQRLSPP